MCIGRRPPRVASKDARSTPHTDRRPVLSQVPAPSRPGGATCWSHAVCSSGVVDSTPPLPGRRQLRDWRGEHPKHVEPASDLFAHGAGHAFSISYGDLIETRIVIVLASDATTPPYSGRRQTRGGVNGASSATAMAASDTAPRTSSMSAVAGTATSTKASAQPRGRVGQRADVTVGTNQTVPSAPRRRVTRRLRSSTVPRSCRQSGCRRCRTGPR